MDQISIQRPGLSDLKIFEKTDGLLPPRIDGKQYFGELGSVGEIWEVKFLLGLV